MPKKNVKHLFPLFGFAAMRVKYKDLFDIKDFYESLHEWLQEHDWYDAEEGSGVGNDRFETYYGERIAQGGVKELWIQWRVMKPANRAPLTYYLDFDWHCIGLTKADVVKEGRKMNVDKGEIELNIRAYLQENYKSDLENSPFLKQFKDIVSKRLYQDQVERRKKELYQETYELQNWIKQFFKLKRYLPYEETKNFYPSKAWPSHLKD